jgi:transcriptional regulator with XRE-family HTH domain
MNGLKALRQNLLMTQKELAKASGIGVATVSRIEAGRVVPSLRTIRSLAQALSRSPEEMRELLLSRQARML